MNKIILCSNLYLPNIGGIENSIKSLSIVGVKNNDNIVVIASNIVDGFLPLDSGLSNEDGILINRYEASRYKNKIFRTINHITSAIRVFRKEKSTNNIVIARYHWTVIFAYLAGFRNIRYLVPGVVKYQNNSKNKRNSSKFIIKIEDTVQRIALNISSKVFVFSPSMKKQVRTISNINPIQVNPGVDSNRFKISNSNNNKVVLLAVSRLVAAKGLEFAIESLVYLPDHFVLNIAGVGEDKNKLEKLAKSLSVINRINFLGKVSNPESLYSNSDIFLLPSIYEPFGQTILEASSCGLPTVAFDSSIVDTATNYILDDFGFYCNSLEAKDYAMTISLAANSLSKNGNYSEELREYIISKFCWDKLYSDLTN
ncbi:glycosyltransferase [Photobacterium phosphoreum]|uniref:glycosyltransferase n=1 Tax=Photobacterium phosphoreum TaxID=659 RepID=UPI001E5C7E5B|nr:glycosyltransferase [Photobacterium phosphoreum]MCD9470817.1 hypothetical protein [Photobacterium phosphoreum]